MIIPCLAILTLIACESEPVEKPAPPSVAADAAVPGKKAEPDPAPVEAAEPDAGPAPSEPSAKEEPGLLPEPDFKLEGPDLKAPSSAPADGAEQPKLLDLDLKKE